MPPMAFASRSASLQPSAAPCAELSWKVCTLEPSCSCLSKAADAAMVPVDASAAVLLSMKHPTPPELVRSKLLEGTEGTDTMMRHCISVSILEHRLWLSAGLQQHHSSPGTLVR